MAIIMHIDFNSYFASVEQQANPFLRGKPIAVGGKAGAAASRSVVATASREAKARGVRTAMATWEAQRVCPELLLIPGDPEKYAEITNRMLTICRKYADKVECFSTDEAFLDLTICAKDYFGATCLAQTIRSELRTSCGSSCTVSIGIAPNLLVAKLAGESVKPHGLTVVQPHDVDAFVRSRPLRDFCGIGHRMEERLAAIGVTSVDTLRAVPRATLLALFNSYGAWLADAAHGIGSTTLADDAPPKSIGHSYTFPNDLLTVREVRANLLALADRVAWRMRRQGVVGRRISVIVRYGDMQSDSIARLLREPINDGLVIEQHAWTLLAPRIDLLRGIRLLGVSISALTTQPMPVPIFQKPQRMQAVLAALDAVQTRFGTTAWQRAATLGTHFRARTSGWYYDHELTGS